MDAPAHQQDLFGRVAPPAAPPAKPPRQPRSAAHLRLPRDDAGRFLREDGIRRAKESERAEWFELAIQLLRTFLAQLPAGAAFAFEDFRAFALGCGLCHPHTHHVWGSLPREAVRAGLIAWTGRYEPARSARTHGHPVKLWRAA